MGVKLVILGVHSYNVSARQVYGPLSRRFEDLVDKRLEAGDHNELRRNHLPLEYLPMKEHL